ncbi:ankyrin-3-like [Chenopodium quinoa]|uniref:ankyrin-3-like n=1 Tax=Chenopodium quinoa TaxID=63459 RepID=UPI000B7923BF|nr:ankyrin-3-like [Chenopodium quinoa]
MASNEAKANATSSSNNNDNEVVYGADELLEAALEGRADEAVEILTKDPTLIQIGDAVGDTAFHVAARAGHETTISKMMEFLDMNNHVKILRDALCEGNAEGDTPLHLALKNGHLDAATLLARNEPSVIYQFNNDEKTPFDLAQQAGYQDLCIRMERVGRHKQLFLPSDIQLGLVRMGLSDDDDDDDEEEEEEEWIRLFKAAARGKLSVIAQIMEDDAYQDIIRYKDNTDCTALHMAAYHGQTKALKMIDELMQSENSFKKLLLGVDRYGNTPLYYAVDGNKENTAIYMVKVAPRATYKANNQGESPLCLAIEKGYLDLVRAMTGMGLDRSIRKHLLSHAKNVSIAHIALEKRNLAVLKAIMEGLPELIDSPNNKGWKPLSYGAYNGCYDEICYIVQEFPEYVMIKDNDGTYPIHKAITGGHVNVVEKLILSCPNVLNCFDKKRNLLEFATYYRKTHVVSYLGGLNYFR